MSISQINAAHSFCNTKTFKYISVRRFVSIRDIKIGVKTTCVAFQDQSLSINSDNSVPIEIREQAPYITM